MVFRDSNLGTRSAQYFCIVFRPFLWLEWGNMYHTDTYRTDSFYSNSALQGFCSLPLPSTCLSFHPCWKSWFFYINTKLFFDSSHNRLEITIPTLAPSIQLLKTTFFPQFPLSLEYVLVKMCIQLTALNSSFCDHTNKWLHI